MTPSENTGKLMTKQIKAADGTTVILTYLRPDAQAMRAFVQSIRLKGNKSPSLSLIARRSIGLYLADLEEARQSNSELFDQEVAALERMVTPVPKPATYSKKKTGCDLAPGFRIP